MCRRISLTESKEPAINPSLSHLALQLSWSAQYLQWRLDVERRAVNDEQLRQITSGALNSVLALRAVAPSKHAAMLDEAAGALRRVADDLLGDGGDEQAAGD